jgi:hypothetical protein
MSNETKQIRKEKDLIAGILYCLVLCRFDYERNEEYDSHDALVYWNGYEFVNEHGNECRDDWDCAIAQSEKPDPEYISSPQTTLVNGEWIDVAVYREQSLAQWRAECVARGVTVSA